MKLHIGGTDPKEGWSILNIQPGDHVDIVGSCADVLPIIDGQVDEIYASHVLEHLPLKEAKKAIGEFCRVLKPGGLVKISVPDLAILSQLFLSPQISRPTRYHVQRIIYGGQLNEHDYHKTGFYDHLLYEILDDCGFEDIRRVDGFDLFPGDCSTVCVEGVAISLNVEARKGLTNQTESEQSK